MLEAVVVLLAFALVVSQYLSRQNADSLIATQQRVITSQQQVITELHSRMILPQPTAIADTTNRYNRPTETVSMPLVPNGEVLRDPLEDLPEDVSEGLI